MIYALAIVSIVALATLAALKQRLPVQGAPFTPLLVRNAHDFALPFTITVWAYAVFSAVLSFELNSDSVDIRPPCVNIT